MAKDATKVGAQKTQSSDQFYYGENNKCLALMAFCLGLFCLIMAIPWSIWAFTSSLWPTSEAWNAQCVIWVKCTLLLMFILPFVNIVFSIVLWCCASSASANFKQCLVLTQAIINSIGSLAKVAWGIYGAYVLSFVESNSTWFLISILMMDLALLLMIVPYVWGLMICFQQCCCANKQQKKHAKKYANLDNVHA